MPKKCLPQPLTCSLLSKSVILLGSPDILLCTLCWETPVISNHPSGDGSCCLPEGLVSWLSSYCLILPSHSLISGHTHLLTHTVSFFTFHSFPPSLESSFPPPPPLLGCCLFQGEPFLIIFFYFLRPCPGLTSSHLAPGHHLCKILRVDDASLWPFLSVFVLKGL